MKDSQFMKDEEDLMRCWQESMAGGPDPGDLARSMAGAVAAFDRKIFWRNFLEYAAGAVLIVTGLWGAWHGDGRSVAVVLCVGFVMSYLWWQHRQVKPLDPSADARAYQTAMVERIDRQIRLLSRVKYWYLLPLTVPMLWQAVEIWQNSPATAVMLLVVVLALFGFVGWLNQVAGVRRLQAERAKVMEMLEGAEQ